MAKVLWFTGLSGSGKTTIAEKLQEELKNSGRTVKILDGDVVRTTLHKHLGFSPEDIKENNHLIAELCLKYSGEYDYILVPIISPFIESRKKARDLLNKDFIEVYIKCPLEKCMERDVKGHYKKVLSGEIKEFIGIHTPYEIPENPEIILDTVNQDVGECVKEIITFFNFNPGVLDNTKNI